MDLIQTKQRTKNSSLHFQQPTLASNIVTVLIQRKQMVFAIDYIIVIRNKILLQYDKKRFSSHAGKSVFQRLIEFPTKHNCAPKTIIFAPCHEKYYYLSQAVVSLYTLNLGFKNIFYVTVYPVSLKNSEARAFAPMQRLFNKMCRSY